MSAFRFKFFLTHILVSILVAITVMGIVYFWYPPPLYIAVGVAKVFIVLLVVDVSLGPILTLIVANPNKTKGKLVGDLLIIAVLQLSALLYGISKIEQGRPIWIAFDTFRFEVVQAAMIDKSERSDIEEYNQQALFSRPNWVSVIPPVDNQDKNDRLFYELEQGFAPSGRPVFYQALELAWPQMNDKADDLQKLYDFNAKEVVDNILDDYPMADAYLPLLSPEIDMAILLNQQQQQIIDIVDLRPW